LHLEDLLTELGHQVIGIVGSIADAVEFARDADIDLAVLDINLAGVPSFPVAAILRQRSIPFVFASGYGDDGLVDGYRHETILRKPFELSDLKQAIAAATRWLSP
jgi:CheY-like chemotaxis protein